MAGSERRLYCIVDGADMVHSFLECSGFRKSYFHAGHVVVAADSDTGRMPVHDEPQLHRQYCRQCIHTKGH